MTAADRAKTSALASWRWVFWAYLPLTAALAAAVRRWVPRGPGSEQVRSLNAGAAALLTVAAMAVVVGTTLIAQPGGRLAGTVVVLLAAPLTAAFIRADRRAAAPYCPRRRWRSRPCAGAPSARSSTPRRPVRP
jgi:hypothetical protein